VRFEYEDKALWYGTPDAPAPGETVQVGADITITMGVQPMNAGNNVEVLYRINQGPTEQVTAKWLRNDTYKKSQYFRASLPALRAGDTVEYTALCRRAGRWVVPAPEEVEHFASSFRVIDTTASPTPEANLDKAIVATQGSAHTALGEAVSPAHPTSPLPMPVQGLAYNAPVQDNARSVVTHQVVGWLVNQETGAPLVGFTVHAFDLDAGATPKDLGYQVTNGMGVFTIVHTTPNEPTSKAGKGVNIGRSYQLHILNPQAQEIYQTQLRVKPDQEQVGEIRVPIPKPPPLALSELATTLKLKLPQQLLPTLAKQGIHSLEDITMAGGIRHLEGLPVAADDPAVRMLEAHANLSVLSSDAQFNAVLIAKGFTGIRKIAHTPQSVFIRAVRDQLGDFKAAQLHVQARAQVKFLSNVLTQIRADKANGFDNPLADHVSDLEELDSCECKDCRAAVSPAAYLLDLLDFAIQKLTDSNSGNSIDLQWLTANFHQPFADLVVSCDAVGTLVHQVRICIEVLRSYLSIGTEFPGESDYRREAYLALLSKIGTSYEEIRLARTDKAEKRSALADRLGIELDTSQHNHGDHLDTLFLDPTTVTEENLEELFGLADTTRNPLSDGAKRGDSANIIARWNLDGVEWGRNTDQEGVIYAIVDVPIQARGGGGGGTSLQVSLFSDAQKQQLVAYGELATGTSAGTVTVLEANNSGLSGRIDFGGNASNIMLTGIELQAVPRFLAWRLKHLRTLWKAQDRPPLPNEGLPIIDPDVIGPDDFRKPNPGEPYFDLWQGRRKAVDDSIAKLANDYQAQGLTFILQDALANPPDPLPDLNALLDSLNTGGDIDKTKATITTITNTLNLTIESFHRLMAIQAKIDAKPPGDPAELQELFAILAEAEKVKLFPSWIAEEQTKNEEQTNKIVLGPDQFWIALKEPDLRPWLATTEARQAWQQALRLRSQPPIIDPALIGPQDLKNTTSNDPATLLLQERFNRLRMLAYAWQNIGKDIDGLIANVLGAPATELLDLADRRTKGEDISPRLDQLSIDLDALVRLLRLRDLVLSDSPLLKEEREEIALILLQTWKRRQFANWRDQEEQQGILLGPDSFVIPPLSLLPSMPAPTFVLQKWVATQEARSTWQDTLQARIDQQQAVKDALRAAVDTCEEETLPILRDALLMAVGPADADLPSKAKWFTTNLLIDAQVNGCQKTTRIAQAIETIQGLLFAIRTGQMPGNITGIPDPTIFDEEWNWIGSYAAWRAAMFIFLYPENVLIPTLRMREQQTPAFRNLISTLRPNRRLTPEQACEAASTYSDYFRDVCNLRVEASCVARTLISSGDCRNKKMAQAERPLFYMFARGTSNTVYWSAYDSYYDSPPQDHSRYSQTFWDTVPGLDKALQIIGAVPYLPRDDQHSILLFAKTQEKGVQKLVLTIYDLLEQKWSEDLIELDLPQKGAMFSAAVEQYVGPDDDLANIPPRLIIYMKGAPGSKQEGQGLLYTRLLNSAATDWEDNDFRLLTIDNTIINVSALVSFPSFFHTSHTNGLFIKTSDNAPRQNLVMWFFSTLAGEPETIFGLSPIGEGAWVGAFMIMEPSYEKLYSFLRDDSSGEVSYGVIPLDKLGLGPITLNFAGPSNLHHIAVHCGQDPTLDGSGRLLAYQYTSSIGAYRSIFTKNAGDDQLQELATAAIMPIDSGPYDITEQLSESDLQQRAYYIFLAYIYTLAGPPSNRVYLDEAYYFVPILIALQLQQVGQYIAALDWFRTVYDYAAPSGLRNIWYGFELEKSLSFVYQRTDDWLLDPLNPHQIAATRAGTYLRFTLLALVRCFLDYADAEFTRDTAESLPRARRLYMTALELLELQELNLHFGQCSNIIGELDIPLGGEWTNVIFSLKQALARIPDVKVLRAVAAQVQEVLHSNDLVETRFEKAKQLVRQAQSSLPPPPTIADLLEQRSNIVDQAGKALIGHPEITETLHRISNVVGQDFLYSVASVSGLSKDQLVKERVDLPWPATPKEGTISRVIESAQPTGHRSQYGNVPFLAHFTSIAPTANTVHAEIMKSIPQIAASRIQQFGGGFVPGSIGFCIPQNPILVALRLRAELNLFKLRNCRNIAGDTRTLEPYAAPTDTFTGLPEIGTNQTIILPGVGIPTPTPYRYAVLIERAKQLVSSAQQIEAAFLSALEKRDAEYYTLLKARQDVSLTKAGVRLQDLRVTEAQSGVKLAELQQERAQLQADHYQTLLDEPISDLELASLDLLRMAATSQVAAAIANFVASGLPSSFVGPNPIFSPQGAATAIAGGLAEIASAQSTIASILSTLASYERRADDWAFQKSLAQQDIRIGAQQVKIAQDHVRVVGQEHKIAELQAEHAEAVAEFLGNKFTSYELYDWMSGVLEGVYSYFLQQATATAQLALNQLAFERQQMPPPFIRADYWQPPSENGQSPDGKAPDRRGLTGSARLLQDITQLDQYRFETDQRKLQLVKTISVASLAPEAFVRFQETGVMTFATPMELFDRDFPGHYLRLIKRVRVSVIALVPPTSGIRATLTSDRISRVVIGGDIFQTVKVQHGPDYVALSSPREATGLFELDVQSEMLLPFEGIGVATNWEFRMPKASNLFDYRTIADVLFTIEYTALNSFTYGQQVIQSLNPNLSAHRPFSFTNQFADQWYDLHNPDQIAPPATPMTVQFSTIGEDFPPNLENLKIQHVALYFVRKEGSIIAVDDVIVQLRFTPKDGTVPVGGSAKPIDGMISTRNGNGSSWTVMLGLSPVGEWELALPNDQQTKNLFANEGIKDILFVITYSGRTPDWPV